MEDFNNPFALSIEEIDKEISIRKARENLIDYELMVNPGYVASKFHKFLCEQVQEFMERKTVAGFDTLLLSVPPQHPWKIFNCY